MPDLFAHWPLALSLSGALSCAGAALILAALAGGSAYVQRWALAGTGRLPWSAAWLLLGGGVGGALLFAATATTDLSGLVGRPIQALPDFGWLVMRLSLGMSLMAAALLAGIAWWDRLASFGLVDAARALARLAMPAVATILVLGLVVDAAGPAGMGPRGETMPDPRPASDPWAPPLLLAIFAIAGLNAGGWARSFAQRGLDRLASVCIGVLPTLLLALVCFFLLRHALLALAMWPLTGQTLLGYAPREPVGSWGMMGRWCLAYSLLVVLMGAGGAVGLRFSPSAARPMPPLDLTGLDPALRDTPLRQRGRGLGAALLRTLAVTSAALPGMGEDPSRPRFPRRSTLALLAAALAIVAFYASLVPLNYRPMSLAEGLEAFRQIRTLPMGIERRADWLANLLLFVPLGFLALGAIGLDRPRRWPALVAAPLVWALLALLAVLIELSQVWFPPRTVSINDIVAEMIGAALGIVAWLVIGQRLVSAVRRITEGGLTARLALLQFYVVALVIYSLLPMDFTFNPADLARKYRDGRIVLAPFTGGDGLPGLLGLVRNVAIYLPLGAFFKLGWDWWGRPRRPLAAAGRVLILAAAIQALRVFIFSTSADSTTILMATAGGLLGALAARRWMAPDGAITLGWGMSMAQRLTFAVPLCLLYGAAVAVLRWRPFHWVEDWPEFLANLRAMFDWPFTKYYYAGEWTALTNLTHYLLLFAVVGALLRWAVGGRLLRPFVGWLLLVGVALGMGLALEVGEAAQAPTVTHVQAEDVETRSVTFRQQARDVSDPNLSKGQHIASGPTADVTDVSAYLLGAIAGWAIIGVFLSRDH